MGYSSRDDELKLVEEKKDDGGGGSHDVLQRRHDDEKRSSASIRSNDLNENSNNDNDNDVAETNEPSYMQLQDPEEQAAAIAANHQAAMLAFAPSNDVEVAAMQHLQVQANLAAQQLLVERQVQQTHLMTSSLNSLQLSATNPAILASAFPGSVAMNVLPTIAPMPVPPFAAGPGQQVLAQQQAAAQAAALNIGAVTSSRAAGVPPSAAAALIARGAATNNSVAPLGIDPIAAASLLAVDPIAAAPLLTADPIAAASLLLAANPAVALGPTNAPVMVGPAVAPAVVVGSAHAHRLSPQMTIPHYVPPIPPTWGAQTPALSVQDRPLVPPIYNGINPNYPGAQLLHAHPPMFAVDNFLSPAECDFLIDAAHDAFGPAPVVGKGSGEVSSSRTSSTCYLAREDLPEYLRKVSLLTGKPAEHCELPQVGRYLPSQQYLQHFDAFDLSSEDGRRFAANGGQRTVTVLVYLNDVPRGGATAFPNLNIEVQPRRGMALVFFPSTLDGLLDKMALHAAQSAVDVKYVSQVWIRQSNYEGRPSKRLAEPMLAGLQEQREAIAQKMFMEHALQQQVQAQQVQAAQLHARVAQQQQHGFQPMNG